ncbi:MBL fold metallo-hydrolase [Candidatus Bathyarchaeota archaeon]|nr:MBL fold metallo-hydrolase [Candidatus Bathyarchaeota archaeon]
MGAAREVGGSCIEVATDQSRVALDYGIKLEGTTDQYPKNFDAIVISHAHLDHSGSLLRLSKSRNKQVIVGSKITRDATVELLKDMIKVNEYNGTPLGCDNQAVDQVIGAWVSTDNLVLPDTHIELYPAGHVAGAAMTGIRAEGKSLLYTGDFCLHDTEILVGCNPQLLPQQPDVLISESTYGGTVRPQRSELIDQMYAEISYTLKHRGNVLIPTFAFHRSQEMAKRIDQAIESGLLPKRNVYMLSKLANKITKIFNGYSPLFKQQTQKLTKPFEYKHVQEIERTTDIEEPALVICTPGFGHAGASLSLLNKWAEVEENTIIVTSGYLPSDSPLKLAKDKRYIKIDGARYPVQAKIVQIELSGHADQRELVQLIEYLKPKRTILVHGDLKEAEALSRQVSELTEVSVPEKNETINI